MNVIEVKASKNYNITIGCGLLANVGDTTRRNTKAEKVCIVSDSSVWPLYGETVVTSINNAGLKCCSFLFSSGEENKTTATYLQLLNYLAENQITRSDCIIALGGGVVGDLAGFAAATYLRGIPYIQVPTTLLAMVDSSVGGTTAIDLPAGKNLCGAFYQPAAVLCDTDVLNTLPEDVFQDGCAEVIKYGILFDPALFAHLEEMDLNFDREHVISRCVELKRTVVAEDEFDTGKRILLNLGHTIGHAIEQCSNYRISHGKAVAIGIAIVSRATKCPDWQRICALLTKFDLPTATEYSAAEICECALMDKKRSGEHINLVIPNSIGDCIIQPTPIEKMKSFIEEGL